MQTHDAWTEFLNAGVQADGHRPWPRFVGGQEMWRAAIEGLSAGLWALSGLWGDTGAVHMALLRDAEFAILTLPCPDGRFPSVGRMHPPAIRLERTISDLYGYVADGAPDVRPWLDHGKWGLHHPLGLAQGKHARPSEYPFLPAQGEGLHQVPVGPVHAGIIEPGHFRFHASGETVVRLEARLGYTHKGIEHLMQGADLEQAARLAGRVSGDSSVAYAIAFCRAVETASDIRIPDRAHWLRALMAELERIANHLGDVGAICNDAAFSLMLAHFGVLRERCLRAVDALFGHRLMRDCVLPGGVRTDLEPNHAETLHQLLGEIRTRLPQLIELYDNTASLQDRTVGAGIATPALAQQFGAGGYVGRASGRAFDARKRLPYPPYPELDFEIPVLEEGDVNARVWVRIKEIQQSLSLVDQILSKLPPGPILARPVPNAGEGCAVVEGFRGDILAWLRMGADGRVMRCHLRDPSWFQWPLLEAAIEGNIVADFPLCNKSFNCSYSGADL